MHSRFFIWLKCLYHKICQKDACSDAAQRSKQRPCKRKPRFFDMDMHKINAHRIKNGFRAAHHNRSAKPGKGIRAVGLE